MKFEKFRPGNKARFALGAGAVALAGAASAQTSGVDVSAVVTDITSAVTAAGTIGLAFLGMVAGVRLYKWIKGAM